MIKGTLNFRIFMGTSSYPYEFLVFRDNLNNFISCGIVSVNSWKCAVKVVTQVTRRIHIIPRFIKSVDNFLWIIRYSVINF